MHCCIVWMVDATLLKRVHVFHQLSVVSVQVLTKLVTVDKYSQFFCVGDDNNYCSLLLNDRKSTTI